MVGKVRFELTTGVISEQNSIPLSYFPIMAEMVGIEPTTYRLTAGCSTVELHLNMVAPKGVEPFNVGLKTRCVHRFTKVPNMG